MLAQIVSPDAADLIRTVVGTWQPAAALAAPLLLGLITSEQTRLKVKMALPVVVAATLAVVGVLSQDGMTWRTLPLSVPVLWGIVEAAYRTLSGIVSVAQGRDASINDVLVPTAGIIK